MRTRRGRSAWTQILSSARGGHWALIEDARQRTVLLCDVGLASWAGMWLAVGLLVGREIHDLRKAGPGARAASRSPGARVTAAPTPPDWPPVVLAG
jgi:hypothetical protein